MSIDWHCAEPWVTANAMRVLACIHAGDTSLSKVARRYNKNPAWASYYAETLTKAGLVHRAGWGDWRATHSTWLESMDGVAAFIKADAERRIAALKAAAGTLPDLPPVERRQHAPNPLAEMQELLDRKQGGQ